MKKKELEELAKEARRKYIREWRRKHPDKVREWNQRYWERKGMKMLEEEGGDKTDE